MRQRFCGTGFRDKRWINWDPCGIFCGFLTWSLIFFGQYATTIHIIIPWTKSSSFSFFHLFLFNFSCIMAFWSHFKASLSNPGAVPLNSIPLIPLEMEENNRKPKLCKRCNLYKPIRAHHCSVCNRCIVKMDHHCPWVNNCVGAENHKFFLLFVFYTFCSCLYALLLVLWNYFMCVWFSETCSTIVWSTAAILILFIICTLFGLFTLCMLCDQLSNIADNMTGIEHLQGQEQESRSFIENMKEVCGGDRFSIWWLFPVCVEFKNREQVLGYTIRTDQSTSFSEEYVDLERAVDVHLPKATTQIESIESIELESIKFAEFIESPLNQSSPQFVQGRYELQADSLKDQSTTANGARESTAEVQSFRRSTVVPDLPKSFTPNPLSLARPHGEIVNIVLDESHRDPSTEQSQIKQKVSLKQD